MLEKFKPLLTNKGVNADFESILPEILSAGELAGILTECGALWLDPTGTLTAGAILCPPEGDAGTGMVATNSITPRTANISAGTSAFLMAVLEKDLESYYEEIDVVTTPHGSPVAMVHVNNFASEITAWTNLFEEVISLGGGHVSRGELFDRLYKKSLQADENVGELMGYNFLAGEPIAKVSEGVPMVIRTPDSSLTLSNFMKMQIYSALGTLAIGCEILEKENVTIDSVCGHGGFFKTPTVGQSAMSAALKAPVTVMENAGEGGAWGIALLALFATSDEENLEQFLADVFANADKTTVSASDTEKASFGKFMQKYRKALALERFASEVI